MAAGESGALESPAHVNSWEFPVVPSLPRALFFPHVLLEWNASGRPQASWRSSSAGLVSEATALVTVRGDPVKN